VGHTSRHRPTRLARKLRQIRRNLHFSQAELIAALKVKEPLYPASISQYESGKREPSLIVLLAYARIADVAVEALIDDRLDLPAVRCKRVVR